MLNIIIRDSDAAFGFGLRSYLEQELSLYYSKQRFINAYGTLRQADILFQAVVEGADCLLALPGIGGKFSGIIFLIMEPSTKPPASACLRHLPVIYRHDSLSVVWDKVLRQLKLWQRVGGEGVLSNVCAACGRSKLTENEIKVLSLLAKEFSLTEAAWVLGKNIKTVFTQKKSAMNKLNLTSGRELSSFIIKHRRALEIL
ncbi:TPA: helix-turn-helix transcriptional regulator [Serratia marcescens]